MPQGQRFGPCAPHGGGALRGPSIHRTPQPVRHAAAAPLPCAGRHACAAATAQIPSKLRTPPPSAAAAICISSRHHVSAHTGARPGTNGHSTGAHRWMICRFSRFQSTWHTHVRKALAARVRSMRTPARYNLQRLSLFSRTRARQARHAIPMRTCFMRLTTLFARALCSSFFCT